ncbi:Imm1 family immunity protein [Rivularia sp. UHCC 0363]|uniref:Imm1 family immunity protein n=1 Tax=Rivularia sp. UHCC 0363 TaxID=3110244 RepID=UPI002B20ACD4|nr:Imm1 family immunity protein [Rivularia sp. UHCC 0363]MEA5598292.1 Imm1 family immunity protein [Rivularia sp. UHCC 0363]
MFVSNLSVEQWIDNFNQDELIEKPTWNQIETAIRELNGKNKTLVTLGADDETYMSIGGGAGKYVVTATFDNFDFYILVNLLKPDDQIEKLVVGAQEGNYSAKMCVDLLPCLLAARTFVESGKLDTLLSWEEDKSLVTA